MGDYFSLWIVLTVSPACVHICLLTSMFTVSTYGIPILFPPWQRVSGDTTKASGPFLQEILHCLRRVCILLTAMIKQFLTDVIWGEVDYLIIDTPPGTSDEHISVVENVKHLNPDGALLVTTPQVEALPCSQAMPLDKN